MGKNNVETSKGRPRKKRKSLIEFDSKARHEFLTGFRKRKQERRKKAKIQLEAELKAEKRKAKQEARDEAEKLAKLDHERIVPEIEHLLNEAEDVQDFGSHEVKVASIDLQKPIEAEKKPLVDAAASKKANKAAMQKLAQSKPFQRASKSTKKSFKKDKKTSKSKRQKHFHPKKSQ